MTRELGSINRQTNPMTNTRKQTTHILPVLLLALLFGAGCSDSKTETQLVGIWEVHESSDPDIIGARINFYEKNIAIMKTADGFSAIKVQYKVEGDNLSFFLMKDEDCDNPIDASPVKIKNNKFVFKTTKSGRLLDKGKLTFMKISN